MSKRRHAWKQAAEVDPTGRVIVIAKCARCGMLRGVSPTNAVHLHVGGPQRRWGTTLPGCSEDGR